MKKAFSMLLAVITLISLTVLPASAEVGAHDEIEVIIHNQELDEETKAKIVAFYTNPEAENEEASTYSLTCTLFGHNYEYEDVVTITHKARTTAPRCLKRTYDHGTCTRCDAQVSTLIGSVYIACCA